MLHRRFLFVPVALSLVLPALPAATAAPAPATAPAVARGAPVAAPAPGAAALAVAWQRIALRTIFSEGATPPQVGVLYLAFTSRAVHDAARRSYGPGGASTRSAVVTAAHDVLAEYFPSSSSNLAADLASSLARIRDGRSKALGITVGHRAAARVIADRSGDGRGDPAIVYERPAAVGVWQPPAGGAMATAWLGFVDPLVHIAPVRLDGPDPLGSTRYTDDYEEVRSLGAADSTARTARETLTAQFYAFNPPLMYRTALCELLESAPLGPRRTTKLFLTIDTAVSTAMIETFRLKYELGYWRPVQAINDLRDDGNPATAPQPGWAPLIANPAYSDYTSGHAAATGPFAEVMRRTFGDGVALHLSNPTLADPAARDRHYTSLSAIEHDALHARIWGGMHFRDAMEDGYLLGHATARRVMRALR